MRDAHKRLYARRPDAAPKTYRTNHVVGLDLVEVKDPFEGTLHFRLNSICRGQRRVDHPAPHLEELARHALARKRRKLPTTTDTYYDRACVCIIC